MSRVFNLLCFLTFASIMMANSSVQDGLVSTPWGKIRGVSKTSPAGFSFTSFEGIPYAKPPLGNLRFSKPLPSTTGSNTNILVADAVKPSCLVANETNESEDCLYLDIYVPHSRSSPPSPLSVMVYIHGGGFLLYNTGNLNPERLLAKNVIVALVHYRLGAMGFLSTGDEVLKGNYGLWDQQLAMKWVKDNVAAFGGDPDSITLFGESAGSASVAYHILAPSSKGLFKRAILQSGTATSSWALSRQPSQIAHALGVRLGCSAGSSSTYLATCLRVVDGIVLQKEMFVQYRSTPPFQHIGDYMYVPVVDHDFVLYEPLELIKNTTHLQRVGAFEIDIIIGVLNNEGSLISLTQDPSMPRVPNFGDFFTKDVVPHMLYQRYGVSTPRVERFVDSCYSHDIPRSLLTRFDVTNVFADVLFVVPSLEFMTALSQTTTTGSGHRYFYYFDYCPSFNPSPVCMAHGYDVVFVFEFSVFNFTTTDQRMSDTFVSLLTSFAKTGTPTAAASANVPQWRQFSKESNYYLRISPQSENKKSLFPNRLRIWTKSVPWLLTSPVNPTPIGG